MIQSVDIAIEVAMVQAIKKGNDHAQPSNINAAFVESVVIMTLDVDGGVTPRTTKDKTPQNLRLLKILFLTFCVYVLILSLYEANVH